MYQRPLSERIFSILIPVFIAAVFLFIIGSFVVRLTSSSKDTVNVAKSYLERMGVQHGPIECMNFDSDGDGYIYHLLTTTFLSRF